MAVVEGLYSFVPRTTPSILFPEYLVEFYPGGPARKYVSALADNDQLTTHIFSDRSTWQHTVLGLLENLIDLENTSSSIYEYEVLVYLSRLWLGMIKNMELPVEDEKTEVAARKQK